MKNRDTTIENNQRRYFGSFFTPPEWAALANDYLTLALGPNWRQDSLVWDPACGAGALTFEFPFEDLILTTLDQEDVDFVTTEQETALVLQYDFLRREDIPDAIHERLVRAAAEKKRLVLFMNPPYGTAGTAIQGTSKAGVAKTPVGDLMKANTMGRCSNQLYAQFMYRCVLLAEQYGFESYAIGLFSQPLFMCSGSYTKFREFWYSRLEYKNGFLFPSGVFQGTSGRWGCTFGVWTGPGKTNGKQPVFYDIWEP